MKVEKEERLSLRKSRLNFLNFGRLALGLALTHLQSCSLETTISVAKV